MPEASWVMLLTCRSGVSRSTWMVAKAVLLVSLDSVTRPLMSPSTYRR